MKTLYCICKEETGSMSTTLYKDVVYRYEHTGIDQIKVYNNLGYYVFFYENTFNEFFCSTKKEIRKYKLEKLNKI